MAAFDMLAVYVVFSTVGASTRALFGLYKVHKRGRIDRVALGSFMMEILSSMFFGTFASMILQEMGWLSLSSETLALIAGFFGADLISIVSRKVGLKSNIDVRMGEEAFLYPELTDRQVRGMEYMKKSGRITNDIYQRLNDISHSSAKRDLRVMQDNKFIKKLGTNRGTYYVLR